MIKVDTKGKFGFFEIPINEKKEGDAVKIVEESQPPGKVEEEKK